MESTPLLTSFHDFGLAEPISRALKEENYLTPTPIQTRDERADQVYAVKIAVANPDGRLRIGMPGELTIPRGRAND